MINHETQYPHNFVESVKTSTPIVIMVCFFYLTIAFFIIKHAVGG